MARAGVTVPAEVPLQFSWPPTQSTCSQSGHFPAGTQACPSFPSSTRDPCGLMGTRTETFQWQPPLGTVTSHLCEGRLGTIHKASFQDPCGCLTKRNAQVTSPETTGCYAQSKSQRRPPGSSAHGGPDAPPRRPTDPALRRRLPSFLSGLLSVLGKANIYCDTEASGN